MKRNTEWIPNYENCRKKTGVSRKTFGLPRNNFGSLRSGFSRRLSQITLNRNNDSAIIMCLLSQNHDGHPKRAILHALKFSNLFSSGWKNSIWRTNAPIVVRVTKFLVNLNSELVYKKYFCNNLIYLYEFSNEVFSTPEVNRKLCDKK